MKMVEAQKNLYDRLADKVKNEFGKKHILVIGDLMVDEYVTGKVSRISPEAPVPVLNFKSEKREAGGASNVANNINALGCTAYIAGIAANDIPGNWMRRYFENKGIKTGGIIPEEGRSTIIKTRFATKGQQLLRVDQETTEPIISSSEAKIFNYISSQKDMLDAVIISDYKKGVLNTPSFVEKIIHFCNKMGILVSIDSKSRHIEAFHGADFVKPNNLELEEAVGVSICDEESFNTAGEAYLNKSQAKALIVTRGPLGISVFRKNQRRQDFPAEEVQVFDVTGAGDTVISTITLGLVSGLKLEESIILANLATGLVISSVGTVTVSRNKLYEKILEKKCLEGEYL